MNKAITTSDWILQTVSDIEYMEDGPARWVSGALQSKVWAIVTNGAETLDAEYEVFYREQVVACITGIFDARDFVAIHSAIARAAGDAGGIYDPATRTFRPHVRPTTPEFDESERRFNAASRAIALNAGI